MMSVLARWRWRLTRRRRLRRVWAAIQEGLADQALRQLAPAGKVSDTEAEALSVIAAVLAAPSLPGAIQCLGALEQLLKPRDPAVLTVAAAALQRALRPDLASGPGQVENVAFLTRRLTRLTGPLPWAHHVLATDAVRRGDFRGAVDFLALAADPPTSASGAAAPGEARLGEALPYALLGAACAVMLGDLGLLARSLSASVGDPAFADDARFLGAVGEVIGCLLDDRPADVARLGPELSASTGPLVRFVPGLPALGVLLGDLVHDRPGWTAPADLAGCQWAQWMCGRRRYVGGDTVAVLAGSRPGADEPTLQWERLGSRQDLLALLAEEDARDIRRRLMATVGRPGGSPPWRQVLELRSVLATGGPDSDVTVADPAGRAEDAIACPWETPDAVLRALASRDAETERSYLYGRMALRLGDLATARARLGEAQARIAGDGLAARVTAWRYRPLLDYWGGVTLAWFSLTDPRLAGQAADLLRACDGGVKGHEAQAQLGLLAVAVGDRAGAAMILAGIPEPLPAAADYLAALLAARRGDEDATEQALDRLVGRRRTAGAYVAVGHRLRGRLREARGDVAEAARWYRKALASRPDDGVAAARLARAWLRLRYEDPGLPAESLLGGRWSLVGDPLLIVRDCLTAVTPSLARDLLGRVPADPALRLLVLRAAVEVGEVDNAVLAARAWAGEPAADPRLAWAGRAIQAAEALRDLCLAGGRGQPRAEAAEAERALRSGPQDPMTAFWADTARLLLSPQSLAAAPPLDAFKDPARPAPVRLLVGLLATFSADPGQRELVARYCQELLDARVPGPGSAPGGGITAVARSVARCLAADALGDDKDFLAAYGELGDRPQALPWGPEAGYLAATEARLRCGDLDAVIEGVIPDVVADLAHPGVRRAIAVAYARRAARTADHDPRAALRDIRQARELLGEAS
jgi:tetratricopeptide (TPR) repeat protein